MDNIFENAKWALDILGNKTVIQVEINGEISSVPVDGENKDYVELMAWVAEGNTIEESGE